MKNVYYEIGFIPDDMTRMFLTGKTLQPVRGEHWANRQPLPENFTEKDVREVMELVDVSIERASL